MACAADRASRTHSTARPASQALRKPDTGAPSARMVSDLSRMEVSVTVPIS